MSGLNIVAVFDCEGCGRLLTITMTGGDDCSYIAGFDHRYVHLKDDAELVFSPKCHHEGCGRVHDFDLIKLLA